MFGVQAVVEDQDCFVRENSGVTQDHSNFGGMHIIYASSSSKHGHCEVIMIFILVADYSILSVNFSNFVFSVVEQFLVFSFHSRQSCVDRKCTIMQDVCGRRGANLVKHDRKMQFDIAHLEKPSLLCSCSHCRGSDNRWQIHSMNLIIVLWF